MIDLGIAAATFGLIFLSELPDKTAIAGLVLGSKYSGKWVFAGVALAFATHVVIAVVAGSLLNLLPRRPVEAVVAVLFLLGAFLVWREGSDGDSEDVEEVTDRGELRTWRVASLGFVVVFISEWGDLTQILTANLAAKYADPLSVGSGSVLALWSVALIAILGGKTLLRLVPVHRITRVAAAVMAGLGTYSLTRAITG